MTTYDLIIRNGKIVTVDSIVQGDIAIAEGKIKEVVVGKNLKRLPKKKLMLKDNIFFRDWSIRMSTLMSRAEPNGKVLKPGVEV